ncbi:hypothetical protein GCM10017083_01540 [Thalassobaculum fulvum]|uniref:Uncharacterized protein n=1 Tax=Thalassobaculum fulvum TaxID=1633335 RepID=A0A918XMG6_9PROT|nr:hypothetical protein [Thalassobaculum fulvum]GHD39562.1 hypothetical protein GCM10017083_01540 [Thalassobaculum fulvum]
MPEGDFMTGASPWSVKGISAEERELAKQAARRAGVPIGQWLSRQIREAAEMERSGRPAGETRFGHPQPGWRDGDGRATGQSGPSPTAAAWRSALSAPPMAAPPMAAPPMAPEMAHPAPVQYAPPPPPAAARPQPPAVEPARVRDLERRVQELRDLETRLAAVEKLERRIGAVAAELSALGARIEDVEKRIDSQAAAVSREIKALGEDVEELRSQPVGGGDAVGSIAASTAPIERAVMRLAERLQRVEELTLPEERAGRGLFARLFRR